MNGTESSVGDYVINSLTASATVGGRGNTGRTIPNTLNEQMAMHQVQSNPLEGATKVPLEIVYNVITGAFDDFKFK